MIMPKMSILVFLFFVFFVFVFILSAIFLYTTGLKALYGPSYCTSTVQCFFYVYCPHVSTHCQNIDLNCVIEVIESSTILNSVVDNMPDFTYE